MSLSRKVSKALRWTNSPRKSKPERYTKSNSPNLSQFIPQNSPNHFSETILFPPLTTSLDFPLFFPKKSISIFFYISLSMSLLPHHSIPTFLSSFFLHTLQWPPNTLQSSPPSPSPNTPTGFFSKLSSIPTMGVLRLWVRNWWSEDGSSPPRKLSERLRRCRSMPMLGRQLMPCLLRLRMWAALSLFSRGFRFLGLCLGCCMEIIYTAVRSWRRLLISRLVLPLLFWPLMMVLVLQAFRYLLFMHANCLLFCYACRTWLTWC